MSTELIVVLATCLFLVLAFTEVPVPLALAASGGVGIVLLRDTAQANAVVGSQTYNAIASYSQSIIPMYILLGMFALHGMLSTRIFLVATRVLGWLPGGLGVASVAACAGFAAVSGSSTATAASLGRVAVQEMRARGYQAHFATGIMAAAATLGILIPPSVAMVTYGIVTGESISRLLLGGVVPGVLLAAVFATYVVAYAALSKNAMTAQRDLRTELALAGGGPRLAPGSDDAFEPAPSGPTPLQLARAMVWILAIIAAVLAGMFTGVFTVIESAAVGAAIALLMVISENLGTGVRGVLRRLGDACLDAAATTSMVLSLFVGASVLSMFLLMARVPNALADWALGLEVPALVIVAAMLLILVPLGMFLDVFSLILVIAPLAHPVVLALGYDGAWFGVMFIILLEISLITPPVGMNTFVVASATGVPVATVFRGAFPFVGVALLFTVMLLLFPDVVTALPDLLLN